MLAGFEDITHDITQEEIGYAKQITAQMLRRPPGKKNAVTNKKICEAILKFKGVKISDIRMRRIVQYIRANNLVPRLCSTSTGYFVAETEKEWSDWKESMRQRIRQQQYTLACAEYFGDGGNEKL